MITAIGGGIIGGLVVRAAPSIVSAVVGIVRPVAKQMVKGGILAYTTVTDLITDLGGDCSKFIEEGISEAQDQAPKVSSSKKGSSNGR